MARWTIIPIYIFTVWTVLAVLAGLTTAAIETRAYLHNSTPQLATAQTVPLRACMITPGSPCRTAYVTATAAKVDKIAKLIFESFIAAVVICVAAMIPAVIRAKRLKQRKT